MCPDYCAVDRVQCAVDELYAYTYYHGSSVVIGAAVILLAAISMEHGPKAQNIP